jgi:hypothetical protein
MGFGNGINVDVGTGRFKEEVDVITGTGGGVEGFGVGVEIGVDEFNLVVEFDVDAAEYLIPRSPIWLKADWISE